MKENEKVITQSTRSDEGCFAFFFRNTPESVDLFAAVIEQFEAKFPDLKNLKISNLNPK